MSAAAYLYALATAGTEEAISWAKELASRMKGATPGANPFEGEYQEATLSSFVRLGGAQRPHLEERLEAIWHGLGRGTDQAANGHGNAFAQEVPEPDRRQAQGIVPLRQHLFVCDYENILRDQLQALRGTRARRDAVLWADGKRSLWDIYQRERAEGQEVALPGLVRFFQLLGEIGYLRLDGGPQR